MPRRTRLALSVFAATALGVAAGGANAGMLASATWTTEVYTGAPPILVPVTALGTSTAASISISVSVPEFTGGFFEDGPSLDYHLALALGGSAQITATPSAAGAATGIPGNIVQKTAMHQAASGWTVGAVTLLDLPLSVGKDGQFTGSFDLLNFPHYVTVNFYGWTPGTRAFYLLTYQGNSLPDLTVMGAFDLTAMGGGNVLLVSPTLISIEGPLARARRVALTTLDLHFVPEPRALLLLAAGAALVLRGCARR